ncbi:MAG TPA: hypothetical protein PKX92_05250 [Edaphocola sp.]|nr:hypothetical protein [Edaphocola sp.]
MSSIIPKNCFDSEVEWEQQAFENSFQQAIPVSIRLNPNKLADIDFDHNVPWANLGRFLKERPTFTLDPLFHAGAYYVQEASSMFLEQALKQHVDFSKSLKILDLCAAPGGKSTLIAALLKDNDLLISNEVIQSRAGILVENLTRWGQMNTWATQNDPADFGKLQNYFDVMVVDAPCSGSGLWRKDDKAIDEWSVANVKLCKERQQRILADVLPALKDDGLLIYSTCSYSNEENEELLDWLVDQFDLESLPLTVDNFQGIVSTQSKNAKAYGYRFYPWRIEGEGFFIGALKKKSSNYNIQSNNNRPKLSKPSIAEQRAQHAFQDFLIPEYSIWNHKEMFYAMHPEHLELWLQLKEKLKFRKAGTALGQMMKEPIPEHDLAMSIHLKENLPKVTLEKEEALLYLKKESVAIDRNLKGWQLACFQGLPLGWGKWMPNRMNNYLPKNLRIRMSLE